MTDDTSNVVALYDDEIDHEVLELRLGGVSIRKIARALNLSEPQVLSSLDRSLPQLTPELRLRLFREDLQRLDELTAHFWVRAKGGDIAASNLLVKLAERRSCMIGGEAATRVEIISANQDQAVKPGATEALLMQLNRIASERTSEAEPSSVP